MQSDQFNCYDPKSSSANYLNRKILNVDDLNHWMKSPGYLDLLSFIRQLNRFATGQHNGFANLSKIKTQKLIELRNLLDILSIKVDQIKPISDKEQRFGNKAFRIWFDEMKNQLDAYFKQSFNEESTNELRQYLEDSFGNRQRIDYGTGHELNFIIYLLGLYKLGNVRNIYTY